MQQSHKCSYDVIVIFCWESYRIHSKNKLLAFLWVDFNAVWIVRTTTIHSTSLLILFQNRWNFYAINFRSIYAFGQYEKKKLNHSKLWLASWPGQHHIIFILKCSERWCTKTRIKKDTSVIYLFNQFIITIRENHCLIETITLGMCLIPLRSKLVN